MTTLGEQNQMKKKEKKKTRFVHGRTRRTPADGVLNGDWARVNLAVTLKTRAASGP
jgi:hypothetical protein